MDSSYLIGVAGFLVLVWGVVAVAGALPVWLLWRATPRAVGEEEALDAIAKALSSKLISKEWLAAAGFRPEDVFGLEAGALRVTVVGWRYRDEQTFCVAYLINGEANSVDLVSGFGEGNCLTTGTTRDGHSLPVCPGSWLQTFDGLLLEELWERHLEGLRFVQPMAGPVQHRGTPLVEDFRSVLARQERHIRSIPLWPLRIPYWYATRRHRRHNRPVAELA